MPLRILLADDSSTAQKMAQKFLEGAGHEVIAVSNGAQALKKIKAEKLDLAILDIFMPGYSGLEVCDKIRVVDETANLPVILTVGKMEHHSPGDAERVKAEGVIIKPFEEKDLLAAVKKIGDKLAAAAAASYEATQKMEPVAEIKDATYEEWKVSAPEPEEIAPSRAASVPDHMASAPAFGMDMLGESSPTQEFTAPTQEISAPDAGRITRALEMSGTAVPHRDPEVEFTLPPREPSSGSASSGLDPALVTDPTEMVSAFPTKFGNFGDEISVGVAADMPEVYEDAGAPADAAAPVEAPAEPPAAAAPPAAEEDDFEARVRAAMSSYEPAPAVEAAPAEVVETRPEATASYDFQAAPAVEPMPPPPPPGWKAEEETLSAGEASLSLEQEMQRAFSAVAVEEEPPPPPPPAEVAPPAVAAAAPAENKPDAELAAAMAVAMGSEVAPAASAAPSATTMVDANTIALIVNRVTERMKPQLIEEIARELAAEMERAKK